MLKKLLGGRMWTGFIWVAVGIGGGLLCLPVWTLFSLKWGKCLDRLSDRHLISKYLFHLWLVILRLTNEMGRWIFSARWEVVFVCLTAVNRRFGPLNFCASILIHVSNVTILLKSCTNNMHAGTSRSSHEWTVTFKRLCPFFVCKN
jgi:hypothetical protein